MSITAAEFYLSNQYDITALVRQDNGTAILTLHWGLCVVCVDDCRPDNDDGLHTAFAETRKIIDALTGGFNSPRPVFGVR